MLYLIQMLNKLETVEPLITWAYKGEKDGYVFFDAYEEVEGEWQLVGKIRVSP